MKSILRNIFLFIVTISIWGCTYQGGSGSFSQYSFPEVEALWIREGEPIIFENESWSPTDEIEVLLDQEVYKVGEYQDVALFVEKKDIRPYERLYTKFGRNQFRYFEKKDK